MAILENLRELFAASSETQSGIQELAQVWQMTIATGIAQWVTTDPTIARSLEGHAKPRTMGNLMV